MLGAPGEAARALECVQRQIDVFSNLPASFALRRILPPSGELTEDAVRAYTTNAFHFVGACSVGTVLEGDLKVKGFDNLRVVDASAIPNIPKNAVCCAFTSTRSLLRRPKAYTAHACMCRVVQTRTRDMLHVVAGIDRTGWVVV